MEEEMGECGCGEINNIARIVKIRDLILVIETYFGCDYCNNGVTISLWLFTEKEAKSYWFETEEVFEPDEYGSADLHIPILGHEDLIAMLPEMESQEHYVSLEEWLSDHGIDWLQKAGYRRMKINGETLEKQRVLKPE